MKYELQTNSQAIRNEGYMDSGTFRSAIMHHRHGSNAGDQLPQVTSEKSALHVSKQSNIGIAFEFSDSGERKEEIAEEEHHGIDEIQRQHQASESDDWSQQKLYGRIRQKEQLFHAYHRRLDRSNGRQAELSIITGPSGSGKSFLARMLEQHMVAEENGYFCSGKCDPLKSSNNNEPFGPFVTALTQFIETALQQQDDIMIQDTKRQVQQVIHKGTEVNLLTDMVPALAKLFDRQSTRGADLDHSSSTHYSSTKSHYEADNPTITAVVKLLKTLCSPDRPIVLFVDDIQWIDASSLNLFQALAGEQDMVGFMLLGTCRGNEVSVNDPIAQVMRRLEEKQQVMITDIALENLTEAAVHDLVVDAFFQSSSSSAVTNGTRDFSTLSRSIFRHTKGNAFFVLQMLRSLQDSGLWTSTHHSNAGEWNMLDDESAVEKLIGLDCDALVDMAIHEAAKTSPVIDSVLKVTSCLGSEFLAQHLHIAVSLESEKIVQALQLLQERHFIRTQNNRGAGREAYIWTHDKFQEASYDILLQQEERELLHLSIGRRLLKGLPEADLQRCMFVVAGQFSLSLVQLVDNGDQEEKQAVATLMLRAGEKSALSSAFEAAADYFAMGVSLLRDDHWVSQYQLSLRLYNAAAEMECCRGHFQQTDKLVDTILQKARTFANRLRAYETKIYALGSRQEMPLAIDLALDVFKQLGEDFPRKPGLLTIAYEMFSTKHMLAKTTEDDILGLRALRDWRKAAVLRIMQLVFPSVMRGCPELAPILACRCIKITLRFGLCAMSCAAFGAFGLVLTHPLGFVEEGNKYAHIGMKILEKYGADEMKCRLTLVLHGFCLPYKTPLRDTLEPLKAAAPLGFLTGDLEIACLSLHCRAITGTFCGLPIESISCEMQDYLQTFREMGQDLLVGHLSVFAQMLENLRVPKDDSCRLTGDALNEAKALERVKIAHDESESINIWLSKAFLALYLGEHKRGKIFMRELRKHSTDGINAAMLYQVFFLDAMIDILVARKAGDKPRKYKSPLKKLRVLAKHAPENVLNKICLIEAEKSALKNNRTFAFSKFEQSINLAKEQGLINEQALACERLAVALLEWGDAGRALELFEEARLLYKQWGSPVKVQQLSDFVLKEFS